MKTFKCFLEEKRDKRIYLDMDGVLVDFVAGIRKLTGTKLDMESKEFSDVVMGVLHKTSSGELSGFWEELPLLSDGLKLAKYISGKGLGLYILSSCSGDLLYCKKEKYKWVKKNIGRYIPRSNVIVTKTATEKLKYLQEGDILIDDFKKNVTRWNSSGGVGIWHVQGMYSKTISQLEKII
jgi:hypothetical protein|tara:strand:+ start:2892 stop:3431 length:540 start_codon:yes stop_codon:yes gene_type:complete